MNDTIDVISIDQNTPLRHIYFNNSTEMKKYLSNELNLIITLAGIEFDDAFSEPKELTPKMDIIFRYNRIFVRFYFLLFII